MCNNNCGCDNNYDIWWIIIIIAVFLFFVCGWGNNYNNSCGTPFDNGCC